MSKTRVTSMHVELIQIFGSILRDQLKMHLFDSECWEIEHVADYNICGERPDENASEDDWGQFMLYENPIHKHHVYLASGHGFPVGYGVIKGRGQRVEMRVRAEFSKWIAASLSHWRIEMWFMLEGGIVERHYFECHRGYGSDRSISSALALLPTMKNLPPKRIKFPSIDKMQPPSYLREKAKV